MICTQGCIDYSMSVTDTMTNVPGLGVGKVNIPPEQGPEGGSSPYCLQSCSTSARRPYIAPISFLA